MIEDDSMLIRNNELLNHGNFDEDYKVNISDIFRPNKAENKKKHNLVQNTYDLKPRMFGKPSLSSIKLIDSKSDPKNDPKKVLNNSRNKIKDSFWEFNDSNGLNNSVLIRDEESLAKKPPIFRNNLNKNKIRLNETNKLEPPEDDNKAAGLNSIMKWSNQLKNNQIMPYGNNSHSNNINKNVIIDEKSNKKTFFDLTNSFTESSQNFAEELSNNTTNKKTTKDKSVSLEAPTTINKLFDIIERESTNFSIKLSYDNPFSNRDDALTPHTYLDLDIDPNLRLARQNTIRNKEMKIIDFDSSEANSKTHKKPFDGSENLRKHFKTPDLYQSLEKSAPVRLYSELVLVEQEPIKSKKKKSSSKHNYITKNNKKGSPKASVKFEKSKKAPKGPPVSELESILMENNYRIIEQRDDDLILYDDKDEKSNGEVNSYHKSPYNPNESFNKLQQSIIFDQNDPLEFQGAYSSANKSVSYNIVEQNKNQINDLDSLISSFKIRDALKETPMKKHSPKQLPKQKSNPKKTTIKEFKYCILTDLKIGEGEFSETFQGYRYDLGPPMKIAAKRLKNYNQKDDQNTMILLSEISVLTQLGRHDNVIEYLGVHTLNNAMYIVFEFAERGDLKRLLDHCRKSPKKEINLTALYKLKIGYEIASGMEYISSLDIVHKDLAARNILLDKDYACKISDFGCCQPTKKVPIRWMVNILF